MKQKCILYGAGARGAGECRGSKYSRTTTNNDTICNSKCMKTPTMDMLLIQNSSSYSNSQVQHIIFMQIKRNFEKLNTTDHTYKVSQDELKQNHANSAKSFKIFPYA